jgi:CheY-like chemotaxis protein
MKPVILVIEDDAAVRDAVLRDLRPFAAVAAIEAAETAEEAWEVVAGLDGGSPLALVLADHRLPGRSGVDLLVELAADPAGRDARKVLVTGQAGHDDTIRAVNEARLDHYIAKPWDPVELVGVVRHLLSEWVVDHAPDVVPYLAHLDPEILLPATRRTSRPD